MLPEKGRSLLLNCNFSQLIGLRKFQSKYFLWDHSQFLMLHFIPWKPNSKWKQQFEQSGSCHFVVLIKWQFIIWDHSRFYFFDIAVFYWWMCLNFKVLLLICCATLLLFAQLLRNLTETKGCTFFLSRVAVKGDGSQQTATSFRWKKLNIHISDSRMKGFQC